MEENKELENNQANKDLEADAIYDKPKEKKKKEREFPWYFYVLIFFGSLFIFYTIFFYLFKFVFWYLRRSAFNMHRIDTPTSANIARYIR